MKQTLTSSHTPWKVISVGLIYKDGKILLGLRPNQKEDLWEFPGGSIEPGELPHQSMIRELKEELSIEVTDYSLASCLSDYKKGYSYLIVFFYVTGWKGDIQKNIHKDLRWLSAEDCKKEGLPNINPNLFSEIQQIIKNLSSK